MLKDKINTLFDTLGASVSEIACFADTIKAYCALNWKQKRDMPLESVQ